MLARYRERAAAVKSRPLPPIAGEERQRFIQQAQSDYMDFAIIGDATASLEEDGVLVLRVDLRDLPIKSREDAQRVGQAWPYPSPQSRCSRGASARCWFAASMRRHPPSSSGDCGSPAPVMLVATYSTGGRVSVPLLKSVFIPRRAVRDLDAGGVHFVPRNVDRSPN